MEIQERINKERRTWDKARLKRVAVARLFALQSKATQQLQRAESDKDSLVSLEGQAQSLSADFNGMDGLPAQWEQMLGIQSLHLSRINDDLASEIEYGKVRVQRLQSIVDRLAELHIEAEAATK